VLSVENPGVWVYAGQRGRPSMNYTSPLGFSRSGSRAPDLESSADSGMHPYHSFISDPLPGSGQIALPILRFCLSGAVSSVRKRQALGAWASAIHRSPFGRSVPGMHQRHWAGARDLMPGHQPGPWEEAEECRWREFGDRWTSRIGSCFVAGEHCGPACINGKQGGFRRPEQPRITLLERQRVAALGGLLQSAAAARRLCCR
jgi:hypothetical protein